MDPFRRGALVMAASPRGADADYRAGGTGPAVPCRVLLTQVDDDNAMKPGVVVQQTVAAGHLPAGVAAVGKGDTLTIGAKVWKLSQKAKDVPGWDWRFYLTGAG